MFKKIVTFSVLILITIALQGLVARGASQDTTINLEVESGGGICDNDNVCDDGRGETEVNCPNDCGCDNDNVCETNRDETASTCSNDCGCDNDGICESERNETVTNCSDCEEEEAAAGGGTMPNVDLQAPQIFNLSVFPVTYSVTIKWSSNEPVIYKLAWGKTTDYTGGKMSSINYKTEHVVKLPDLTHSTQYHFKIYLWDKNKNETISKDQTLKTLALPDTEPPANVENLKKEEQEEKIELKWENPLDPDFEGIRIVKNPDFYPQDINDGEVVFEGDKNSFIDKQVFDEDYYYSIFSYDKLKNFSSEAIIKARPKKAPQPPYKPPKPPVRPPVKSEKIEKLTLQDLEFWQNGNKLPFKENQLLGDAGKPMKILIAYDKVPEVLKTIIVSLSNDKNEVFSFLLRVDKAKEVYQATIVAPYKAGFYPLTVNVFDFQHQSLKKMAGALFLKEAVVAAKIPQKEENNFWIIIGRLLVVITGLGLLSMVGYIAWKISKKTQLFKHQIPSTK